jgi:C_GCAxxG_C_C family probable redox protein
MSATNSLCRKKERCNGVKAARKEEILALQDRAEEGARTYFKTGLTCSESVLKSFLDLGLGEAGPEVVALATGFGNGIGNTRSLCGCVAGAVLALGTVYGRKNPLERETPAERVAQLRGEDGIYAPFQALMEEFTGKFGTAICAELSAPLGEFDGKERKRNCLQLTGYAARLAVKYALASREELARWEEA